MSILDVLKIWVTSVEQLVNDAGGSVLFSRSSADRLNASAHVVITRGQNEAELILWESGEAEYARVETGAVREQHFDDVADPGLGVVLTWLLEVLNE